jgi:ribonuclease R
MAKIASPMEYSEHRLRQALELNATPVSVTSMVQAFGLKEADKKHVEDTLKALVKEGFAFSDKSGKYAAVEPMSDLVVARVGKIVPGKPVPLYPQGVEDDFPFPITLSANQVRKQTATKALHEGDKIAVVLWRYNSTELKARFIDKFTNKKSPTIVGHFNEKSGATSPTFSTHDSGIKTLFAATGLIPEDLDRKKSYWASIPSDFDPFHPWLEIGEQKWDPDTGTPIAEILAKKHGVQIKHPLAARAEAKYTIQRNVEFEGRRDLTQERILVIDPKDARDHDDGIMIQRTPDGFRTLVVVADVPFYVRPGSELDKSASNRGFSHYFDDDTYHMLPKRLVEHASLSDDMQKPVIYVEQFWDESAEPIGLPEIGAGVIASQRKMTYGQFQDLVDNNNQNIQSYLEFGDIMIPRMRFEDSLSFDSDSAYNRESYSQALVQALMIEANSAIAEYLLDKDIPFLSRAHSGSDNLFAFEETKEKLEEWGYDVPDDIRDMNASMLNNLIRESQLRGQQQQVETLIKSKFLHRAVYSTVALSHFGLNRENYTHATSPIRRYGDILTLRGVHTSLGNDELGLSEADIDSMKRTTAILNNLQDVSRRVALDRPKYYAVRDLLRLEGHMVRATLNRVERDRVEILLPERFGLRKSFDVASLPENWVVRPYSNSLIYNGDTIVPERSNVRLRITNVRPHEADWDFEGLEPVISRKTPAPRPVQPGPISAVA